METKNAAKSKHLPLVYKTVGLTFIALLAFAANSLFCRLALAPMPTSDTIEAMDPYSFTFLRLLSGALMLTVLSLISRWMTRAGDARQATSPQCGDSVPAKKPTWIRRFASLWLALYALGFSLAYVELGAALGALILFATVQFTLMTAALVQRESLSKRQWLGFLFALSGFLWLVTPALTVANDTSERGLAGALLMIISGIAWGFYTLAGRGSEAPVKESRNYFAGALLWLLLFAVLFVLFASLLLDEITLHLNIDTRGLSLAVASGALASGLGYVIWYQALRYLQASYAAVSQLMVPILAAIGAAIWLEEPITLSLLIAGSLVLLGIGLMTVKTRSD